MDRWKITIFISLIVLFLGSIVSLAYGEGRRPVNARVMRDPAYLLKKDNTWPGTQNFTDGSFTNLGVNAGPNSGASLFIVAETLTSGCTPVHVAGPNGRGLFTMRGDSLDISLDLNVWGTVTLYGITSAYYGFRGNSSGTNSDSWIASENDNTCFFVDASLDAIGIGGYPGSGVSLAVKGLAGFGSGVSLASGTSICWGGTGIGAAGIWHIPGGNGELWASNDVGTATQLTSHDPETNEIWVNSYNIYTGEGERYYPKRNVTIAYAVPKVDYVQVQSGLQEKAFRENWVAVNTHEIEVVTGTRDVVVGTKEAERIIKDFDGSDKIVIDTVNVIEKQDIMGIEIVTPTGEEITEAMKGYEYNPAKARKLPGWIVDKIGLPDVYRRK